MDRARYGRLKEVVVAALERTGAAREDYLRDACRGDDGLLADARALLAREREATSLEAAVLPVAAFLGPGPALPPPERIGRYEITGVLGEGGMGVVYRGLQTEPIRREVAVKVLRAGHDTARVLARFSWERRSLARLDHPHIARILDAGSDDAGRPYVVLELVEGEPVTRWCEGTGLGLQGRVALLAQVCRAVQHAHDRGVLHRDLKPGNVLVRGVDGAPVPKVIDFGIAKALDETDDDLTLEGQRVGTPAYMSPEQRAGAEVDVRSDVYALGCILYELVAGVRPDRVEDGAVRAPSGAAAGAAVAWRRRLRGDLDRIACMAVRPERERRYASAAALADDLERWAQGRPVAATPDSWSYRTRKAARRHPLRVALATAAAGFVVAGVAFLAYHADRLDRERVRALAAEQAARTEAAAAAEIATFLEDLFTEADTSTGGAAETTARDLLEQGYLRLQDELADQPLVRGRLSGVVGRVLQGMGLHERAVEIATRALDDLADAPPDTVYLAERAEVLSILGLALHDLGRYAGAEQAARRAVDLRRQLQPEPNVDLVWALVDLATDVQAQGRLDEARILMEEALANGAAVGPEADRAVAWTRNMLGYLLSKQGRYHEARDIFADVLARQKEFIAGDDVELINTYNNLGAISLDMGDLVQAERCAEDGLAMLRRLYPGDHPAVARGLKNLGNVRLVQGRVDAADTLLAAAVAMNRRTLGGDHRNTLLALGDLGDLRRAQGRDDEALACYRRALAGLTALYGGGSVYSLRARGDLGRHYLLTGEPASARAELEPAVAGLERVLAPGHPVLVEARLDLADALLALAQRERAHGLLTAALPRLEDLYGNTDRRSRRARDLLAASR